MTERESLFEDRDSTVPFCDGGAAACEICVGSCGIEEYEAEREAANDDE